ncbi:MAG TPA: lysophospholipid acyltransferase family protein [Chitinophagaceae bacterium]|nr:lysophospholipid acyltransferase family protein [Chitinophagaceae bacterium]
MKWIKSVFGRLFALYALVLFILTLVVIIIPVWFSTFIRDEYKRTSIIMAELRIWMAVYLRLICCPVKQKGLQHFKSGQNYVVVFNHNSLMDVPVSTTGIPGPNKTLAKVEIARVPVFGTIYKAGSVLVDRSSEQSRRSSLEKMKMVLEQGMHLALYPEGTRNKSNKPLKSFYEGAFSVAIAAQKPVIPALIFSTRSILPPDKPFYAWPHSIGLHFLEPVGTGGLTQRDVPMLKEKIFGIMSDYYSQHAPVK